MKKDIFKKHHFWFLLGAVPLLLGILFILLMVEPASEIAKAATSFKGKMSETSQQKPPGKGVLDDLDKQKDELEKRRDDLWKTNYERQRVSGVLQWPRASRDPVLEAFEKAGLPFGFNIVEALDSSLPAEKQYIQRNDEIQKFTKADNYLEAYKTLAESIAPTLYEKGSWESVLRFVSDWKNGRPPFQQFWLALEDFWIQRALLGPIKTVNDSIARFNDLSPKDATKKFQFQSRIWDLEMELAAETGATVLKSKLKNRTDRLQVLGTGKSMRLNVWIDDPARSQPFEYRIEGEIVKGNEEIIPRFVLALHRLPAGSNPDRIWKVEQVFDISTVPVRLVRRIDLGFPDSKRATTALKTPKFLEDPVAEGAAPGTPANPAEAFTPAPRGGVEGGGMVPGTGAAGMAPALGPKTGTHEEVLLGNKKRYTEVNEQIRRMPVGIVIVVDQAYIGDLLVAYANSPLRFHTTQVQMQRFRDSLPIVAPAGTATAGIATAGTPARGGELATGAPGTAAVSETQSTAGLVEIAIYGIVTFYEQYKPKSATPAPAITPAIAPAPKPPAPAN